MRIAVLITCHNRKEKSLACLKALFHNVLPDGDSLDVFLVDDGSTDGTSEAVLARYPLVEIIKGDGNLYWGKGMHCAFARAMEIGFDVYLWLNDDTTLYTAAIDTMVSAWHRTKNQTGKDAIIVGSTQDPDTAQLTYGGVVRHSALKRFSYTLVKPCSQPIECHTMNGNCVLVPNSVVLRLGNLEKRFAHAMGDIDYGLRAGQAGIKVFVAPGCIGTCERNDSQGTFNDRSLSLRARWRKMMQPTGLPPASWWILTQRHGGLLGSVYWVWPYFRVILSK
jgi:GT2 family glycosyltransferase